MKGFKLHLTNVNSAMNDLNDYSSLGRKSDMADTDDNSHKEYT